MFQVIASLQMRMRLIPTVGSAARVLQNSRFASWDLSPLSRLETNMRVTRKAWDGSEQTAEESKRRRQPQYRLSWR